MSNVIVLRHQKTYIVIGTPLDDLDKIRAEIPNLKQGEWKLSSLDDLYRAYQAPRVGQVYVGVELAKELRRLTGWIEHEYSDDTEYKLVTNGEVGRVLMFYACHLRKWKHRYWPINRNTLGQCATCYNYAQAVGVRPVKLKKETSK